jgi:hypothetical protein
MQRFVSQFLLFALLALASMAAVLWQADGHTDAYYLKCSSPRQSGLILGTSKAAQGLQPAIFADSLHPPLYNYAFSLGISPFGPTYHRAIMRKLDPTTKGGLFVITVDPWSIASKAERPNDSSQFRERALCLRPKAQTHTQPNWGYLLHHFEGGFYQLLWPSAAAYLHDDGWLEVNLPLDSASVNRRRAGTMRYYGSLRPNYQYSSLRLQSLQQTIMALAAHGRVYLLRMPVPPELMAIERALMPDFEARIQPAAQLADGYLDLSDWQASLYDTDGCHLTAASGRRVSAQVAAWIKEMESHEGR